MAIRDDEWFEIWYTGADVIPVYILVAVSDPNHIGSIRVVDPLKKNEVVYSAKTYEEICSWLWEDEYDLVDGRQFPDDGW